MSSKNLNNNKILEQVTYNNGYAAYLPWSKSIGFKIHSLRYQDQQLSYRVAEDFLANLGFSRGNIESECSIGAYLENAGTMMLSYANCEDTHQFKKTSLPVAAPLRMSLDNAIQSRRSIRQFTGDSVPFSYLAAILKAGGGITARNEVNLANGMNASLNYRTIPSAGGIYPVDLYLISLKVEKLEQAVYQYNPLENCLVQLFDKNVIDKLLNCFSVSEDQISLKRAGFICCMVGTAHKSMHKYGSQGASFMLQEIGGIAQNIHLAATALGLGSVDCASYYNTEMHQMLHLDGIYKNLLHTVVVGVNQ